MIGGNSKMIKEKQKQFMLPKYYHGLITMQAYNYCNQIWRIKL